MGEKLQSIKSIRVWILGASICATMFVALSAKYEFWAIQTYIDYGTHEENTTYFGLWTKCLDQRQGNNASQPKFPMTEICEDYGDGNLGGIDGTPVFIKVTRVFLIILIVILGISSIFTTVILILTKKRLIYFSAPPLTLASIIGVIILGVFLTPLDHNDEFKDYTPAWAFYYFLIAWFFAISALIGSLTDRS